MMSVICQPIKKNIYLQALIISVLMVSCTGEKDKSLEDDPYLVQISQELEKVGTSGARIIDIPVLYNPGRGLRWNNEQLVIVDEARKSLELLHVDGTLLSRTGRQGNGPGEFEVINQLHKGSGGYLYVLDRMQSRISKFRVEDGELIYVRSFSPEVPDQNMIEEIFVTDTGPYVLYNHTDDYSSGENSYHLYSADRQFDPVEFLFEFEGIEKMPFRQGAHIDHPLAGRSLWAQSANNFFTLHSHDTSWERIDLQGNESVSYTFLNENDRAISERSASYLEQRLEPVINAIPAVSDAIRDAEQLPLHHSFLVEAEWAVITTFYAGSTDGVVIIHNTESDHTHYTKVPSHFTPFSFNGNELFGISRPSEEQVKIMLIEIDW
ncbi:6-bladed beta-propeller [Rhodohalobacter sp. SW132]|uniref:6-bladed beta-propeller n=1 Tax=Rhodohalobacter sp. SW132 TaxID=2293433 RepID=UPI000E24FC46|nr:6-bladed beta-propeller [Rhodohalobacter sp. SW132]REL33516.1 6-bladed beta-propeller [Rhodohalobacter sp. SW132]